MKRTPIELAQAKLEKGNQLFEKVEKFIKDQKEITPNKKNKALYSLWSCVKSYAAGSYYDACTAMYKLLRISTRRYPESTVAETLKIKLRTAAQLLKNPKSQKESLQLTLALQT